MAPTLFPDIYEHILAQLPIQSGSQHDDSVQTLVQCIKAARILQSIATLSHIWEPHYHARWTTGNDSTSETSGLSDTKADYYTLYARRRSLDTEALEMLDRVIHHRGERHDASFTFVERLGFDIWDILKSQVVPPPKSFALADAPSLDWFSRNYWAAQIPDSITRLEAVKTALELEDTPNISFEEALSVYSGFQGVRYTEIKRQLDELAAECRVWLGEQNISLDEEDASYDRIALVLEICNWMREQGFIAATDSYHALQNHFMNRVLTSHRKTLPLSLVVVFVSLATRLGVPAAPVGFPGRVHALVFLPPLSVPIASRSRYAAYYDDVQHGIHVDVFGASSTGEPLLDMATLLRRGTRSELEPTDVVELVRRAGRNIMTSTQLVHAAEDWEKDVALYAVFCIFLVPAHAGFGAAMNFVDHIVSIVRHRYPCDIGPILQGRIKPALYGAARESINTGCDAIVKEDSEYAIPQTRYDTKYFVGMVFIHRIFDYIGVILEGDDECEASEEWIRRFGIASLERGRHQPFYQVAVPNGQSRFYVAEDNVITLARLHRHSRLSTSQHAYKSATEICQELITGFPGLARHFLRPEVIEGDDGTDDIGLNRARFVPSAETLVRFPGDEEKVAEYMTTGKVIGLPEDGLAGTEWNPRGDGVLQ